MPRAGRFLQIGGGAQLSAAVLELGAGIELDVLEPDPERAAVCTRAGARVHLHDLEWPAPFLSAGSFAAAVISQSVWDAPSTRAVIASELDRLVEPRGLCALATNGDRGKWRELRRSSQRNVPLAAGPLALPGGHTLHPWGPPSPLLPAAKDAWDSVSRRDFTPLTTAEKDEARGPDGAWEAVFTGYRRLGGGETLRAICRATTDITGTWVRDQDPLLEATSARGWDAGGVAAGSFVRLDDGTVRLFLSGRDAAGTWVGVGIADRGPDGTWRRSPEPTLTTKDFRGLTHLALADVIRRADGSWLMHMEGMREERWTIVQAVSADGVNWRPSTPEPVFVGAEVCWAGTHLANPKCIELDGGVLLLAFNGAGPARDFQLGLATSVDGRVWQPVGQGPIRCTEEGEHRIESLFLTRTAWRRGDRTAFWFSAATTQTHESSDIVSATADRESSWPSPPWRSDRLDLYRIADGYLTARPGATEPSHALVCDQPGGGDTSGAIAAGLAGGGTVRVVVRDAGTEIPLIDAAQAGVDAWAVRMRAGVATVRGWREGALILDLERTLAERAAQLRTEVAVPPGADPLVLDHLHVSAPPGEQSLVGDAHVYAGVTRSTDPLLPDITPEQLIATLEGAGVGHALTAPYGVTAQLDSFDDLARAARLRPSLVHPLIRIRRTAAEAPEWTVDQLEHLWQQRLLFGLKVHMGTDPVPPVEVLEWLAKRSLPSIWHVARSADLDRLEGEVLPLLESPVLLSHFGGYPLDRARYARAIELLDRWPQLRLVTSMVWFHPYLREAAARHPRRVLLGSDFPAAYPVVAQTAVRQLDLPATDEADVLGGNLRSLLDRTVEVRERAAASDDFRFPPVPQTPAEVEAQGIVVVAPDALSASEPTQAKHFWAGYGVRSFYRDPKPWDQLPATLARDIGAESVLEFGCNFGRNLAAVREMIPDAHIVGLDINADAVAAGREATGLDLRTGDEAALADFPASAFDLVFTVSVLSHVVEVDLILEQLLRCAGRVAYFLEVSLPVEGRVDRHFDHAERRVRESTGASYSWDLEHRLRDDPRTWRVDRRPIYMHPNSLGPYYAAWTAWLDPPG